MSKAEKAVETEADVARKALEDRIAELEKAKNELVGEINHAVELRSRLRELDRHLTEAHNDLSRAQK